VLVRFTNCRDLLAGLSIARDFIDGFYPDAQLDVQVKYIDRTLYSIPGGNGIHMGETKQRSDFFKAFHKALMKHKLKVVR